MCMANHFRSDPRDERQRPICIVICAVDQAGESTAKDVIGDKKKMRRTQEKFQQCTAVPRAKFARLEPGESTI